MKNTPPTLVRRRTLTTLFRSKLKYCVVTEKVNHLKINRARSRKTLRKTYLKVNRKTRATCPRKTPAQDRHKKNTSAIRKATNKKSAIREGTKKKSATREGTKIFLKVFLKYG